MPARRVEVPAAALSRGRSGVDVHAEHSGGEQPGEPCFVCVHGLGGSALNWSLLAPRLVALGGQVWAPDLAGFGLTAPTGRRATVADNLDLLEGFVRTVAPGRRVVLVGNSMGGLLSILLAASAPELVAGLVVCAPASPRPLRAPFDAQVAAHFALLATPGIGERWLRARARRVDPAAQVRATMALCVPDVDALDPAVIAAHTALARRRRAMPYAQTALLDAARSMLRLLGPNARTLWRAVDAVRAPTLLLHGERDRLVAAAGMAAVAARRRDWTFRSYPDLGHVPMLEDPDRVAADIAAWLPQACRPTTSVHR